MTPEQKKEYMQEWRAKNSEKMREYQAKYRETNREYFREKDREYYAANPESYRIRQKEYQKNNLASFAKRAADWADKNHAGCLLRAARNRAKKNGMPFDIDLSDINIPDVCPILKTRILRIHGKRTGQSATLDRIDNSKGYVKGNVWVISSKANLMKNSASLAELVLFGEWCSTLKSNT